MTNNRWKNSVPGKGPPQMSNANQTPDKRERLNYREHHPQARTRQQVVRQGVAREPLEHGQEQQRHPDDPVDLTRTAEGPSEENAAHVERN